MSRVSANASRKPGRSRRAPRLALILVAAALSPACAVSLGDDDTLVALIDTGVNTGLAEFSGYTIEQAESAPSSNHGTMVLSVLLGVNEGSDQIPADRVRVLSLDVGDGATATDLADAIETAVDARADLISISMGVRRPNSRLEATVRRAHDAGILIVASAGNVRFLSPDYPARFESALSVSAIDSGGNYATTAARTSTDAVALGVNIPVLLPDGSRRHESGASFATAAVSRTIVRELISGAIDRATEHVPQRPPPGDQ